MCHAINTEANIYYADDNQWSEWESIHLICLRCANSIVCHQNDNEKQEREIINKIQKYPKTKTIKLTASIKQTVYHYMFG